MKKETQGCKYCGYEKTSKRTKKPFDEFIKELDIKDEKDVLVICLITLGKSLKDSTANLKAPIIINIKNNRGKQLILQDDKYKIKEPLE